MLYFAESHITVNGVDGKHLMERHISFIGKLVLKFEKLLVI